MLILKRNISETIKIGPDITIMLTDVGKGWARIGIDAPKDTQIVRDDAKQQTKRDA